MPCMPITLSVGVPGCIDFAQLRWVLHACAIRVSGCRRRVLPFLRGPGVSAAEAAGLATALLGEEVQRRPGWAAALSEAEADAMEASASAGGSAAGLLFGGAEQMVKVRLRLCSRLRTLFLPACSTKYSLAGALRTAPAL